MPLPTALRNRLASVIKDARREGEAGAMRSLQGLAVDWHEPHGSMSLEERTLRNRLRAHGRQLGDTRDRGRGTQEIKRLTHEVAYEHWHRMLFARFLAENNLLVEPESSVAISMAECEDLAREHGEDPWVLAGRYAQRMLPRIFRPDDPALAVALAPETRQALERLLESLPVEVFTSDDALGWTYQFWQAERKDEVNASEVKIGADELPVVTQLFTEHYIVLFLLHNTIGAWRAAKLLSEQPDLAMNAESEEELRRAVRLRSAGGYEFSHLRFTRTAREGDEGGAPSGPWRPVAGAFEQWPAVASELRVLDPCCGSGHFLVEALQLMVRLRMDEESLSAEKALRAVLAENLWGLEIDLRCTQIAAFNLALAAWKLVERPIELPQLRIACSGTAPNTTKAEWLHVAGQDERLRGTMDELFELFKRAPELGSLIDLRQPGANLLRSDSESVEPLLLSIIEQHAGDPDLGERATAAAGMTLAADILSREFDLVATNVPFLGLERQAPSLSQFLKDYHPIAKRDLATSFLMRSLSFAGDRGVVALVQPGEWTFLRPHRHFRRELLSSSRVRMLVRLGQDAFSSAIRVNPVLFIGDNMPPQETAYTELDPVEYVDKSQTLRESALAIVMQQDWIQNPDSRILAEASPNESLLAEIAEARTGLSAGDSSRFEAHFWEVDEFKYTWQVLQSSVSNTELFGGRSRVVRWEDERGDMAKLAESVKHLNHAAQNWRRGKPSWGRHGIALSLMGKLPSTIYYGDRYDINCCAIVPKSPENIPAVIAFAMSGELSKAVRRIDHSLKVGSPNTILSVPFDVSHWKAVAQSTYPDGVPQPHSDDPTQWLFHGHPAAAEPQTALQVAVARLVGYRWPLEKEPIVSVGSATWEWAERCRDLDSFADGDGIVCLNAARGEPNAVDRLRGLLAATFGRSGLAAKERELLIAAAGDSQPAGSLENWLRDRFFEEHCRLFQHRPFVWHVWDGRRDGFHALLNYHRLASPHGGGKRTLEALAYSYLGDWIQRQSTEQLGGNEGAAGRLVAALDLQNQLQGILAGEPPYDLFVRWKSVHEQPIGWEPDIDDGVRLNIRPFMNAQLRTGGRKGAGILRWKPNINWKKDRGIESSILRPREEFPWFWRSPGAGSAGERTDFAGGADFDGIRWNDLYYTSAAKQAAREQASRQIPV